jgi:uroporphyrinogen-III synthase
VAEDRPSSLAGKRIVITRAAEQSATLVQALQERGATPILFPLLTFAPPENTAPFDSALRKINEFDWIFLTSQNALRALVERSGTLGISLAEATVKVRIAAVGPATAEAAAHAGLHVAHVASRHQGTSLAEELAPELPGKSVLLPRSDRANPDLVEMLRKTGARVTDVIAYRTSLPDDFGKSGSPVFTRGGADAILFFSPSAVHHCEELLGVEEFRKLQDTSALTAIGPVTAAALRDAGVQRIVLAADTTLAAVLDALAEFFAGARQQAPTGVKRA